MLNRKRKQTQKRMFRIQRNGTRLHESNIYILCDI